MTRIRLYLDEDTQRRGLVRAIEARGYDVLTTFEAGRAAFSDEDQLTYSAAEGRAILTFNSRDFVRLHREYLGGNRSHAGIIVSDQLETGVLVRRLLRLLQSRSAEDMVNWLEFLSSWR
jgi:hypothetical protein